MAGRIASSVLLRTWICSLLTGTLAVAASGPFQPTEALLKQYRCPEWFRDAKLGIWAVWGPESVPQQGDWYARRMYVEGDPAYTYHVKHYGHPSKFGFKDVIPLWKAERWDPDGLMALYKKAGAKYFCMIAEHHDNFDCWNSTHQEWNCVRLGPKRDIAGEWQKAAAKYGLRFGMTEHLAASWWFYSAAKGADTKGPLAGVPYDGADPRYAPLYWTGNEHPAENFYCPHAPDFVKQQWFDRIKDMIDRYHPDLVYSDSPLPYPDEFGRKLLAHYYNDSARRHAGRVESVYNCKQDSQGMWVQDLERGVMHQIHEHPWQTDTCVGGWYYDVNLAQNHGYKSAATVLHMLADIVSKNGNLLLNFPPLPDGTLDADELRILEEMTQWMPINGEAIFGTRPWKVFGEGAAKIRGGMFNEDSLRYTAKDVRFTTKDDALYAILLGWPEDGRAAIRSLATPAGRIASVALLGHPEKLAWSQTGEGLIVTLPDKKPCKHAFVLKIAGSQLTPSPLPPPAPLGPAKDGKITLKAADAEIHGTSPQYERDGEKDQIGYWANPQDYVFWSIKIAKPGAHHVAVTYSCQPGAEGSRFVIELGDQQLVGTSKPTHSWSTYRTDSLGEVRTPKPGVYTLAVKPRAEPAWKVIGLKSVVLEPAVGGAKTALGQTAPIRAFCVDFNWGPGGPNGFAAPGHWAGADPVAHVAWYEQLGANVIQTFAVSCNGYAWYQGGKIPAQPGLKYDFLTEVVKRAHEKKMRVMGYFCVASNTRWAKEHPELSYGCPSDYHLPLTDAYLDYLGVAIEEALKKTDMDGFVVDWLWNPKDEVRAAQNRGRWLDCDQHLFQTLVGKPFPSQGAPSAADRGVYERRAIERCWRRIHDTAKRVKPSCVVWISCNNVLDPALQRTSVLKEADWFMDESGSPEKMKAIAPLLGPNTHPMLCVVGWGDGHNARRILTDPSSARCGIYGFMAPGADSLPLPIARYLGQPADRFQGNDRNVAVLARVYTGRPLDYVTRAAPIAK